MIQNNQIQNNNIFSLFPQYSLEQAIPVKNDSQNGTVKTDTKPDEKKDKLEISKENQGKGSKRKKILFGSTLASTILTAGVLSMVFTKGFHGSSLKKFSKLSEKLASDIQAQSNTTKDLATKTAYYSRKGAKKTIDTMQATSNFTAIKDWIADKAFRTNKATSKFADGSTKFFKKVVDRTLGKKYDKVEVKVQDLTSLLKHYNISNLSELNAADKMQSVTIKDKTLPLGEWIELLSKQTQRLETNFNGSFSLGARKLRDKKRTKLLSGLSEKIQQRFFKDKKSLFNPENYKTYATEDLTKDAQKQLREEILGARKQITNNITNIHDSMKTTLSSVNQTIKPEDTASKAGVAEMKKLFESFKNCSGANEAQAREKISKEISSVIDNITTSIKQNSSYSEKEQAEMLKCLSSIKETVLSTGLDSKGSLEEIMTILTGLNRSALKSSGEKIISDANLKEFSKLSSSISKGLEKATELEMGEYFLKQAELKVGSAPTDVLSVLFPIGVGAYSVAKGDDKEEKISATLTTCIPLVGTFATFVYGTSKMLSGAKNLAFSFVSGILLSKLGSYCDKLYKKYRNSGSVVNVVKDEYDNFMTDITPKYAQPLKEDDAQKK